MKRFLAGLLPAILGLTLNAQTLETGITGGGTLYTGDLNPKPAPGLFQPAGGIVVRHNFNTRWAWKSNLIIGKLKGDDLQGETLSGRSLNFETTLTELSTQIEFNFFPYFTGSSRDNFSPYLFGGISLFMFNPKAEYNGQMVELQPLHTEGQNTSMYPDRSPYGRIALALPFGMGIKYGIGKKLCVGFEAGYRKTFTDYIDDVSTTYYLEGDKIDPAVAAEVMSDPGRNHSPGMQRGNSRNTDWYGFAGVFITYKFNLYKTPPCNDFNNIQKFN